VAGVGFEIVEGIPIGAGARPVYIAGPCVIESPEHVLGVAERLAGVARRCGIPLVFKASFDKANRSSVESFRGPGLEAGLEALAEVKRRTGLRVLTDVHEPWQAERAAEVVDVLQVPAFLCRQTDLLVACGRTGLPVNVKKGQFMAPEDMALAVEKVRSTGNGRVFLTERGTSFGYHDLVVDFRGVPAMREVAPVVFDVTHSLQLPGGMGTQSGGVRRFALDLARAAAAVGVDGFFVEVHPDPDRALSDAATQLDPERFERLVEQVEALWPVVREVTR